MNKEELEKENVELKNNNKVYCEGNGETLVVNVSFDSFTRINANHKMYYPHKSVKELQEENAKLRKDKKELCHSISEGGKACVYLNEQLTKAKQIIRDLINLTEPTSTEEVQHWNETFRKAEQFIKDSEGK